ncbi:hypothetical protein EPUS_00674 [Endocarpon pusillum Z07020]|uniref:DUF6590 domain-containing protein n=1 Tax=Endocarpon pusillum (strain Z07020 / HMAS-L-300199) TaxID=1263415 RepID=U1HYG3_ENDPU|nr:uncharacterized protein EPUS_00674 [Endocarpon pusillum Z07020]ERF74544.1 hypothetical protein EPUS_00674 [Endocarpon pusillum Z07020]
MSDQFPLKGSSYSTVLKTPAEVVKDTPDKSTILKTPSKPEQKRMEAPKAKGRAAEIDKSNRFEHRRLDPGTIFIAEHYEGAGSDSNFGLIREDGVTADGITTCASHRPIVIKDRKFIVLFVHTYQYICIPLFTYQKDGANSRRDEEEHVSVEDCRLHTPRTIQQSQWKPLRTLYMTPEAHALAANTAARVTFPISRAKNFPVEVLGALDNESIERLKELFIIFNDLAPNGEVKTRLENKHRDPTWTGAPSAMTIPGSTTANENLNPPPGLGLPTASTSFGSTSPAARSQRTFGQSWRTHSSGQSGSYQAGGFDWGRLGQRRAGAASRSQGSQGEGAGQGGGDSQGSDQQSGRGHLPQSFFYAQRRARRSWRPVMDKIGMKASAWSGDGGSAKKNKRKAEDRGDDEGGEKRRDQPQGQVRRSGRKRTKVGSYAE